MNYPPPRKCSLSASNQCGIQIKNLILHFSLCLAFTSLLSIPKTAFVQSNSWSTEGNHNIQSGDFLGSSDYSPLEFRTDSVSRVYISESGNIGIGTTNPGAALDVASGDVKIQALSGIGYKMVMVNPNGLLQTSTLLPEGPSGGSTCNAVLDGWSYNLANGAVLQLCDHYHSVQIGSTPVQTDAQMSALKLDIRGNQRVSGKLYVNEIFTRYFSDDLVFGTDYQEQMRISEDGEFTLNPEAGVFPGVRFSLETEPADDAGILLVSEAGTDWKYGMKVSVDRNNTKALAVSNTNNVSLNAPDGEDVFRVYGSGNVECKAVKVTLQGWGDDVFEEDYELLPLGELRDFVKIYRHLPGVPSENEIISGGVDLGGMQEKMIRKIEEITLYVLELDRSLKALQEENRELKLQLAFKPGIQK